MRETNAFLRLVRADLARNGVRSLEAVEMGLREAMAKDACKLIEELYNGVGVALADNRCQRGERHHQQRPKQVATIFGEVTLRRDYYHRAGTAGQKGQGRAPLDEALGLVHGTSPGLVRLACRAAARMGFEHASEDLAALANIHLQGRQIQRLVQLSTPKVERMRDQLPAPLPEADTPVLYVSMDGTGVPMVAEELAGRDGKQPDGSSRTREVKLGCVFTQSTCDKDGHPVRDLDSSTYIGSFAPASEFAVQLRAEAQRRGMGRSTKVVVLGDGAAWIRESVRTCFPFATQILDLYHALERLHALCQGLYPRSALWMDRQHQRWRDLILNDQVTTFIQEAKIRLRSLGPLPDDSLQKQIGYFANHHQYMHYLTYRRQGLFCGSGVIEAGCKTVVGQRLKLSGMFWSASGAHNILSLRCTLLSNLWDQTWDSLLDSSYLRSSSAA